MRRCDVRMMSPPSTTKESVPRVREAFLPTASVSGTFMCSWVGAESCDGCEGAALLVSRGSLKGSSEPASEAMINEMSRKGRAACCEEGETRSQFETRPEQEAR